jgi:hypothetical protein
MLDSSLPVSVLPFAASRISTARNDCPHLRPVIGENAVLDEIVDGSSRRWIGDMQGRGSATAEVRFDEQGWVADVASSSGQ